MAGPWTGIDELDDVLAELVDNASSVIRDDLIGVYLQGSFALGGTDGESDCDFLVVTSSPVDETQLEALREFHGGLPGRRGYWPRHLEGSYARSDDLADIDRCGRPWPYINHGSDQVVLDPHCNNEITRWTLYERGVTLRGPRPQTLLGRVPAETMRAAAGRDLRRAADDWERQRTWDAWSQRYAVVTMPRRLRTQMMGDVVSKPAAVAWALEVLDPQWRPLLETALTERGRRPWDAPISPERARRTLEFVRYVARVSASGERPRDPSDPTT